jgi:hypothetical protein
MRIEMHVEREIYLRLAYRLDVNEVQYEHNKLQGSGACHI